MGHLPLGPEAAADISPPSPLVKGRHSQPETAGPQLIAGKVQPSQQKGRSKAQAAQVRAQAQTHVQRALAVRLRLSGGNSCVLPKLVEPHQLSLAV